MVPADAQQMLLLKEDAPEEHGPGFDIQGPESLSPTMNEDDEEFLLSSHLHQHHIQDRELPVDHCEAAELKKKTLDSMRKVQVELKISCDDNGKTCKKNPSSKSHARTLAGHKHLCKLCGHTFNERRNLDRHMRIHTGEKPFSCHLCGYRCSIKSSLKKHMRIHTGEKPFSCDLCGYRCSMKSNLNQHMRIHTGEKPFSCHLCGYRCSIKSSLNVHIKTHTGEKPFSCGCCGFRFGRKSRLKDRETAVSSHPSGKISRTADRLQNSSRNRLTDV
uniref:C2H2-type domain-containing protein n=1 Tax=Xiphophorus couchianus TaxID=32473 RepID=A0A3B5MA52_9TELE